MATINISQKELIRILKEELAEAENDDLMRAVLKVVIKEFKTYGWCIDGTEVGTLRKLLNEY